MAAALQAIRREPQPGGAAVSARMLADLRGGLEIYHGHLRERVEYARRAERVDRLRARVRRNPLLRRLLALRRYRAVRVTARPFRPLTRRVRRVLS